MTLKEYFDSHKINATPDQRSHIGRLIAKEDDSTGFVSEDRYKVKDYISEHLDSPETSDLIINFLTTPKL